MIAGKKIVVVMPAYNAARTLERTLRAIPASAADDIILCDDASTDGTVAVARRLGLTTIVHERNRGYGANQKTCYAAALEARADVVVMLHPDFQYDPSLVPAMVAPISAGRADAVLGSRLADGRARQGGMPGHKFIANRLLTGFENVVLGAKLSEYHTGYRAWSRGLLEKLPWRGYADGFLFDAQMLTDAVVAGFRIAEISCPARYAADSSSIGLGRSIAYGLGVIGVTLAARTRRG